MASDGKYRSGALVNLAASSVLLLEWTVRPGAAEDLTCAVGTSLDPLTNSCRCDVDCATCGQPIDTSKVYIAGLFDTAGSQAWGKEIFLEVISMINDHGDGWHDELFLDGATVVAEVVNASCDPDIATREYWSLKTHWGQPLHGVVGCRCSGASMAVARIAGLQDVPMVSHSSSSSKLSEVGKFRSFSRVVAPDDHRGQVGALISIFRSFGWDRVSVISTDTQYTKDLLIAFTEHWVGDHHDSTGSWTGQIGYSHTMRLTKDGTVDNETVRRALDGVPTDDPSVNSRAILLFAHNQHTYHILKYAQEIDFQPDTIWVGTDAWAKQLPEDTSWMPELPGYLGVVPYQDENAKKYKDFLHRLQDAQRADRRTVMDKMPEYGAATMVDSILALAMALSSISPEARGDSDAVMTALRAVNFNGVSGDIRFTEEGDLADPRFEIVNLRNKDRDFERVGITGPTPDTTNIKIKEICWPDDGCGLEKAPEVTKPEPSAPFPVWILGVILPFFAVCAGAFFIYRRKKIRRSRQLRADVAAKEFELEAFRDSVVGMRVAARQHVPLVPHIPRKSLKGSILKKVAPLSPLPSRPESLPAVWCWKETPSFMSKHDSCDNYGDPSDCWVRYDETSTSILESSYQDQGHVGECKHPLPGYIVNFNTMTQVKESSGFQREVQRVPVSSSGATPHQEGALTQSDVSIDMEMESSEALPPELAEEPQLVLVEGDVIQVAETRPDGWTFGTVLTHSDEELSNKLQQLSLGRAAGAVDDSSVSVHTGWFPTEATKPPTAEDLKVLQDNLGAAGAGAMAPPEYWDPIVDGSVVQRHELPDGDFERVKVVDAFMSTLKPPKFQRKTRVVRVERIENLAMWQSYVVKRQVICSRETGRFEDGNAANDSEATSKALMRFERCWLWHATNSEVIPKILQQGFNRSFCGKNATFYGKGVYFARDAAYSANSTYAPPDQNGIRYMLACRVVTGEYCVGRKDALTPDLRDAKKNILYDSTVALLSGDTMASPSVYVTYHDAQAYPEYLIAFRLI